LKERELYIGLPGEIEEAIKIFPEMLARFEGITRDTEILSNLFH
jgi:hypothetical protein